MVNWTDGGFALTLGWIATGFLFFSDLSYFSDLFYFSDLSECLGLEFDVFIFLLKLTMFHIIL